MLEEFGEKNLTNVVEQIFIEFLTCEALFQTTEIQIYPTEC